MLQVAAFEIEQQEDWRYKEGEEEKKNAKPETGQSNPKCARNESRYNLPSKKIMLSRRATFLLFRSHTQNS